MANTTKYQRAYSLRVTTKSGLDITIKLPFTVQFDIERHNYASANRAEIRIYNLSKIHRAAIQMDQWILGYMNVSFHAGYGEGPQWPLIFSGNAHRAYSYRQGVDFITVIEAFDGGNGIREAYTAFSAPADTPMNSILSQMANDLAPYGVSVGAISDFPGTVPRGQAFSGNTMQLLSELSNNNAFIDSSALNILKAGDVIAREALLINSATGLLGTPIKEQTYILLETLFEPRVAVGTLVQVQSTTFTPSLEAVKKPYDGTHEVSSVHHKGTISAAVAGEAITSLGLRAGVFQGVLSQAGL
jgi:hypothetical protein